MYENNPMNQSYGNQASDGMGNQNVGYQPNQSMGYQGNQNMGYQPDVNMGFNPNMGMPQQPQKKSNKLLIALAIIIPVLLIIGGVVLFLIFGKGDSKEKKTPKKTSGSSLNNSGSSKNKDNNNARGNDEDDEEESNQIISDVFMAMEDTDEDAIYDCFYVENEDFENDAKEMYELSLSISDYTDIDYYSIEFESEEFDESDKWIDNIEKIIDADVEKAYSVTADVPMTQTMNNVEYDVVETYEVYTMKVDGEWYIGYMESISTDYKKVDNQSGSGGSTGITGNSNGKMDFSCIAQPYEGTRKGDSTLGYVNLPDEFEVETDESSVTYCSTVDENNCFGVFCLEDADDISTEEFLEQLKKEIQSDCAEIKVENSDYICDGSYYLNSVIIEKNAAVEMYVFKDPDTSNLYWLVLSYENGNSQQRDYMRSILASYNLYE